MISRRVMLAALLVGYTERLRRGPLSWTAICVALAAGRLAAPPAANGGPPSGPAAAVSGPALWRRLPATELPSQRRYAAVQAAAQREVVPPGPVDPAAPIPPQVIAQPAWTIEAATALTLANHPQLTETDSQAVAARARAYQASLYPNPIFGTASPQLAGDQSQYNAYVVQDIVTRNKIGLDTAAARRAAREAELAAVRARYDVLTQLRERFFTALVHQERVEILRRMVEVARTAEQIAERLYKAEEGTKGDLLLLQIEASRADVELKNAVTMLEISKRQLAAATGLYELDVGQVEGDVRHRFPSYTLAEVQQQAIARNATSQSAQVEIARTQFVLRRAEVEPFPNLNMMGGYQNQQPGALAPQSQGMYQVQMVVPLWNRNQGNIRAAQAGVTAAVAQWNRVQVELASSAAAAVGRYRTAQQVVDRFEHTVLPSAQELLSIQEQLYRHGQTQFLIYLNAQRALLGANLDYLAALEARWIAAAEIAGLLQLDQFP